jgi:hypothetical protein
LVRPDTAIRPSWSVIVTLQRRRHYVTFNLYVLELT